MKSNTKKAAVTEKTTTKTEKGAPAKPVKVAKPAKVEASTPAVVETPPPPSPFVRTMGRGGSPMKAFTLQTFHEFCVPAKYAGAAFLAVFDGASVKAVPCAITETANADRPKVKLAGEDKPKGVDRSLLFKTEAEFASALDLATTLCTTRLGAADISDEDFGTGNLWGHTGRIVAVYCPGTVGFVEGPQLGQLDKSTVEVRHADDIKDLALVPTKAPSGEDIYFNLPRGTYKGKPCAQVYHGFAKNPLDEWTTVAAVLGEDLYDPRIATDEFIWSSFRQLVSEPAKREFFGRTAAESFEEALKNVNMELDEKGEPTTKKAKAPPKKATNPTKGSALSKGGPTPLWTADQIVEWLGRQDKVNAAKELTKGVNPLTVLNEYDITDPTHRAAIITVFGKKASEPTIQQVASDLKSHVVPSDKTAKASPKPTKRTKAN